MATSTSPKGGDDFISKFERFGKALKQYQWWFQNPLTSFIILLAIALVVSIAGIPIDPVLAILSGFIPLLNTVKGIVQ